MMQTTLDFAPRAHPEMGDKIERQNSSDGGEGGILSWNESNHNFLLQQAAGGHGGFTLLARNYDVMKASAFA